MRTGTVLFITIMLITVVAEAVMLWLNSLGFSDAIIIDVAIMVLGCMGIAVWLQKRRRKNVMGVRYFHRVFLVISGITAGNVLVLLYWTFFMTHNVSTEFWLALDHNSTASLLVLLPNAIVGLIAYLLGDALFGDYSAKNRSNVL